MPVDVICPDCGGVIGGDLTGADGRSPCTCHVGSETGRFIPPDASDTVSIPSPPAPSSGEAPEKVCLVCGKNLVGHRRVKDSRGYTCYDCAKAERAEEIAGKVQCAECGKRVKEAGLVEYNGLRICRKCHMDHLETDKHKVRKVKTYQFEKEEKRTIVILAIVLGILGMFVIYGHFFRH